MISTGINKRIVLVSSGQPSANPRLVKEAIALFAAGYMVTVFYCPLSTWADQFDDQLFSHHPGIKWVRTGYHPIYEKWKYRYACARQKLFQVVYACFGNKFDAAIKSLVLFSQELTRAAKKELADLYIGHNLGALPAVVKVASHFKAKAVFDFEDFHRGEACENSALWKKIAEIEESYVPFLTYATTASPLTTLQYKQLLPTCDFLTINNCFSIKFSVNASFNYPNHPLKLFWFSQTIGKGRGLEDIVGALKVLPVGAFNLYLLGNCSEETKDYFNKLSEIDNFRRISITYLAPRHPNDIFALASQFDIGLALEPGRDINNQVALSNKIFTYLLVGNAIIFTSTPAQQFFYNENSNVGSIYKPGDIKALASILENYLSNPTLLRDQKRNALKMSREKYNWESESKKIFQKITEIMNDE